MRNPIVRRRRPSCTEHAPSVVATSAAIFDRCSRKPSVEHVEKFDSKSLRPNFNWPVGSSLFAISKIEERVATTFSFELQSLHRLRPERGARNVLLQASFCQPEVKGDTPDFRSKRSRFGEKSNSIGASPRLAIYRVEFD